MAKVTFKPYPQYETLLLPPSLSELIPATHPVRLVNAVLDKIDISELKSTYVGGGASSYNPRMLLKVIVYGYLCNIYSGRQLEKVITENINFMWLAGMSRPDFRTINLFRSKRLKSGVFEKIFVRVVKLLQEEGLISLEVQYIDGTKIESAANKYTFVWRGSIEKNKEKLITKVHGVLKQANEVLKRENDENAPKEMTAEEFKEKAANMLEKLEKEQTAEKKTVKSLNKVVNEDAPRLKRYEEQLKIMGKRNSYSKTDTDATFMRMKEDAMRNGQTKPGYNVQIATENQYITNYDIYWRPTDTGTLIPFLNSFYAKYGSYGTEIVADSGYGSEQNYEFMFEQGLTPYVKFNMFHKEMKRAFKNNSFLPANMFYNAAKDYYVCPMGQHLTFCGIAETSSDLGYISTISFYRAQNCKGCPLRGMCYKGKADRRTIQINHKNNAYRNKARELLMSEKGLMHRGRRPIEPEAVFGDIKYNHGFKRFRLRSKDKVKVEFGLVALAHNLRKYFKQITQREQKMMIAA